MKISKADRKKFRLKFQEKLDKHNEGMETFDNSGFSSKDITLQRNQANKEFSALAKKNIQMQAKTYQKIKNFRIV